MILRQNNSIMSVPTPAVYSAGYYSGYTTSYNSGFTAGQNYDPAPWVRNPEWLPIPDIAVDEQVAYILVRVDNVDLSANTHRVQITAVGGYTVDWGDGVISGYTSATNAIHMYDYNDPNLSGLTTNESINYKQALIKITATGNITYAQMNLMIATSYSVPKSLDIICRFPYLTSLNYLVGITANSVPYLERVLILSDYITPMNTITFINCVALKIVRLNCITNLATAMFQSCKLLSNLSNVFVGGISNCVDLNNVFYACNNLIKQPSWFLPSSANTSLVGTFYQTTSLNEINFGDITNVVGFSSSVYYTSAKKIMFTGTSKKITSFALSMFAALKIENINNSKKLTLNADALINGGLNSVFYGTNLEEVTLTAKTTDYLGTAAQLFTGCLKLKKFNFSFNLKADSLLNSFNGCVALENLDIDLVNITNITGFIGGSNNALKTCRLRNFTSTGATGSNVISIAYTAMNRQAIVDFFGDLSNRSATTAGTVTITGAMGAVDLTAADRLIATAKNWSITG